MATPNMGLAQPTPGADGDVWGEEINSNSDIVDGHNHASGKGVPIPSAGININDDLPFGSNRATQLGGIVLRDAVADDDDLGATYRKSKDLYFTDGDGNNVRITANGAVAGTPGSIAGLTSPAAATYSSGDGTFTWEQDTNTPAPMDSGPVTFPLRSSGLMLMVFPAPAATKTPYR